jgi:tetratricopeptide (TPR) repeat protein
MRGVQLLLESGRHAELESAVLALLTQRPLEGVLWQWLAVAQRAQGKDALPPLQRAVELMPQSAPAHNNLGNGFAGAGRHQEAVASYRRALQLEPAFPEACNNLGNVLLELGQHAEAAAAFRRAVEHRPDYAEAWSQWGSAARASGQLSEAEAHYHRALQLNPQLAEAHYGLGVVLRDLDRLDEAVASYRRALSLSPDDADLHRDLAVALRLQGSTDEAEAGARHALTLQADSAPTIVVLADICADRGRFADAERLLQRALALDAANPEALAALAGLRPMTPSDAGWLRQVQSIAASGLPPRREVPLRYALGKYYDDMGETGQAFAQFQRANELTRRYRAPHDRQQLTRAIDACVATLPEHMPVAAAGVPTGRAVFIVGMARSGTSLAEQILASHPQVFGAGELIDWSRAATRWQAALARGDAGDPLLHALRDAYLRRLEALAPDALRVLDKMPANFQHLGLIRRALPDARIIHMQRHPLDTCLSIYFQHFEATHSYANDLDDLVHAYGEYRRVMRHWRRVLPADRLLEVPYEGLVDNAELWTRRMLEFIGLPWDPRCLAFEHTERIVLTASRWQVRQRLNRSSIGRWNRYQAYLAPLQALMGSQPVADSSF